LIQYAKIICYILVTDITLSPMYLPLQKPEEIYTALFRRCCHQRKYSRSGRNRIPANEVVRRLHPKSRPWSYILHI